MAKGIRVAAKGKDALQGASKDLAFTSESQSFKINTDFHDVIREITVPVAATATVTIHHDLLYKPVFRLFVESPPGSGKWYNDSNSLDNLDDPKALVWSIVDVNSVTIKLIFVTPGACTIRHKYWLFQDSLDAL